MNEITEVYFKYDRKAYFLNQKDIKLHTGQYVIVEAEKGADIGKIGFFPIDTKKVKIDKAKLQKIVRLANKQDLERLNHVREMEKDAKPKFLEALDKQPFEMRLVDVEYQFDGNKLTFYFMAESRVDFRNFLKDLASIFHTRIELRQINERQEIERLGGFGACGRELCCKIVHLKCEKANPKMIKDQNISSTFSKISGLCGRLLCCLAYEEQLYQEMAKEFPPLDKIITYKQKKMRVTRNNYLASSVELKDENDVSRTISLSDYKQIKSGKEKKQK